MIGICPPILKNTVPIIANTHTVILPPRAIRRFLGIFARREKREDRRAEGGIFIFGCFIAIVSGDFLCFFACDVLSGLGMIG